MTPKEDGKSSIMCQLNVKTFLTFRANGKLISLSEICEMRFSTHKDTFFTDCSTKGRTDVGSVNLARAD